MSAYPAGRRIENGDRVVIDSVSSRALTLVSVDGANRMTFAADGGGELHIKSDVFWQAYVRRGLVTLIGEAA